MFLLNDRQIKEYEAHKLIHISDFKKDSLHSTYYYFRLGRHYQIWDPLQRDFVPGVLGEPGKEVLVLPPYGYAKIVSLERFALSSRVMAIFGQISDLTNMGLRLNHSPFIDPHYEANLHFAIENCLDRKVELAYGKDIGKIKFFDVSDTYPVLDALGTPSEEKFEMRRSLDDRSDGPWIDHPRESQQDWE